MLGYDETVAINYFGKYLQGYYLQNHSIFDALKYVRTNYKKIDKKLTAFDDKLQRDIAVKCDGFSDEYYNVIVASLRQSIAAHKLVCDGNDLLFLSKECWSNGSIATVDITYPSSPLYLLYNPELVKGMMRPILRFARMPVWNFDFAPHDAGTYPACNGQGYGVKKSVEECANMLIMFYACYRYDNDISFFSQNVDLAAKWVNYLVNNGLRPANQLCTDDFAGHLANNLNLAIKATVGIACYAGLLRAIGSAADADKYRKIAENFAAEIETFGNKLDHLPLTWDSDCGTYSLKYNMAFDKVLGLGLFSDGIAEREVDFYLSKLNEYGVPLDNRKGYTKSDWLVWAASLSDDKSKQSKLIAALDKYLRTSYERIPFADWYETESTLHHEFLARSVQGGCFMLLLKK